jgi:hypothetical protein
MGGLCSPLLHHTTMIDIQQDIKRIIFSGDFSELVTVKKSDNSIFTIYGIFGYQAENPQVENVAISDAKKLTLTVSRNSLADLGLTIETTDILTIRSRDYSPIVKPVDNLNGLVTVELGERD